jgi:uncharacterized membrane protein
MNILMLVLRLVHIVGGIFWVGAALLMNFFIAPTLRATGDSGRQVGGYFAMQTRFSQVMSISVWATLIAGFLMYGLDSNWFRSAWMMSSVGTGFGLGAVFAVVGMVTGFMNGNNIRKLGALGAQIQGKPTPEQAAQLGAIAQQQAWVVPVNSWTLLIAAVLMAVSRYLVF